MPRGRPPPTSRSANPIRILRRRLLAWFAREKRELPWRGTRDPYRVWISEVMLQQTTVAAVARRYERFLRQFPDVASLARASQDQVLAAWSGLGYYGRARNLLLTARILERAHGGQLPRDQAALEKLPGFGPYTAAAVAAIAWEAAAPAADANVTRVLSRLDALPGLAGSRAHRQAVLSRMEELLPREAPGDFTAALMDLGQLVCTPREPACPRCPLAPSCAARREGRPERYPRRQARARPVRVCVAAADARRGSRALLIRREGPLLAGMWAFPAAEGSTPGQARRRLAAMMAALGLRLSRAAPSGNATHTVVNRRLWIDVYPAILNPKSKIQNPKSVGRWFRPEDLERAAIPTLTRKIARATGFLRR
ncbi:MAG: A/G-specific adenine glycosylase [Thermoanaerobaculia bacterium]